MILEDFFISPQKDVLGEAKLEGEAEGQSDWLLKGEPTLFDHDPLHPFKSINYQR